VFLREKPVREVESNVSAIANGSLGSLANGVVPEQAAANLSSLIHNNIHRCSVCFKVGCDCVMIEHSLLGFLGW